MKLTIELVQVRLPTGTAYIAVAKREGHEGTHYAYARASTARAAAVRCVVKTHEYIALELSMPNANLQQHESTTVELSLAARELLAKDGTVL